MTSGVVVAQAAIPPWLQETVGSTLAFIPRLIGAVVILLVGWVVGREYVEENIARWMGSAREAAPSYGTRQSGAEGSTADDD